MSYDKPEPEYLRKLFLGGLSFSTTEETLRDHFSQWGEVVDCVVMKHPNSAQSRGFGFVTYSHSSMVDESQQHRPHRIDNRNIEPKRAIPRELIGEISSEANIRKLFVGGLRDDITEEDLREYFSQFGNLTDCLLAVDRETQKPRGFGFVEFEDYDPTDKIVLQKVHEIKGKKINVKKAISKSEMQNKKNPGGMGMGGPRTWTKDPPMGNGYGRNGPGMGMGMGGHGMGMGNGYGPNGPPSLGHGYSTGGPSGVGGGYGDSSWNLGETHMSGGWNTNGSGGGGGAGNGGGVGGQNWSPNWGNNNSSIGPMRGGFQNSRPAPYKRRN
uniref:RRM domain-containing protein n=1 Tax=Cuerna arida TaxID=1464854 RepID=A0A1B6GUB8_9HEMI